MTWGHKYWKDRPAPAPPPVPYRGRNLWIFERDRWTCQICRKKLDPALAGKQGDDDAPTVDHIIPRSKGGSERADNKQTACAACNHAKGSKYEPKGLSQSRDSGPAGSDRTMDASAEDHRVWPRWWKPPCR